MIKELNHTERQIAEQIREVFQASYKIEAALLGATEFPPLKRPLEHFINSSNQFFGFVKGTALAGVIEIESKRNLTDINSLVVHPDFFRQGVGRALIEYTFQHFQTDQYVVETGVDNLPAVTLYQKLGFKEVMQWDTTMASER